MNINIINEFTKLINYVNLKLDKFKDKNDIDNIKNYTYKIRQLKRILYIINKYPEEFTLDTFNKDFTIQGMGKKSINRIKEIIKYGKLSELKNFKNIDNKESIINELESIIGVGRYNALKLYKKGIKSIKDLKNKIKLKKIKVSDKIKNGIKYYGKFLGNIPRKEISKLKKKLDNIFFNINKKINKNDKYIFEICGSYRREKNVSGDIDILISKLNTNNNIFNKSNNNILSLYDIINILKKKFDIVDITNKKYKTKFMGFIKNKESILRRIDIRFVSFENYYSSLLYFTGSADLNRKMRNVAKKKGYKLSEYGLSNINNNSEKIVINSEKYVFDFLDLKYLKPNER
jgi:DNA polymerase/3'-5' exonuclease PolX